jgi:hypothetical protein
VECVPRCHITWLRNEAPIFPPLLTSSENNYSFAQAAFSVEEEEVPADHTTNTFPSLLSTLIYRRRVGTTSAAGDPEDGSNFTCEARSGEPSQRAVLRSTTLFRVEYPPRELRLSSSQLVVSEHAVPSPVTCSGPAQPAPRYQWTFNGHVVVRGPRLTFPSGILR